MDRIQEMKNQRAEHIRQARALLDAAKQANRSLTEAEVAEYQGHVDAASEIRANIEREEQLRALEGEINQPDHTPILPETNPQGGETRDNTHIEVRDRQVGPFRSLGEQLRAVMQAAAPGSTVDPRLMQVRAASGASEGISADGGFLVQTDFSSEIIKRAYDTGLLAGRTRKIPISANANGLKINGIDESSRVAGSRWGGVRVYWAAEADTVDATKPKFRQMTLNLQKLMGVCYATDEVLQDTTALESVITQAFGEEYAYVLDDVIMWGDGVGKPLGFMNSPAKVAVAKETSQTADTVVVQNIVKMWSRCWGRSRQNAVWLINQDIEPQLYLMSLTVGSGGVPVYMPANGISGSPFSTLFGRPVIPIEQASTLGDEGDISLVDLSQYLLIDKGGVNTAQSVHVRFLYGENTFRFTYRVDGQPIWHKPLTPAKGSNTLSPFITLAVRS